MLFAGEIVPKYIGLLNDISFSYFVVRPINFLQNLIRPIRILTINIAAPISRALFFYLKPEESISREELKHVLEKIARIWGASSR